MSAEDAVKAIRIKTGSLRRLFRERAMYADEVKMGQEKVARMKSDASVDLADLRQQENVLEESEMMVKDNATRVHDAYDSLAATTEHFEGDAEVTVSEEYKLALELMAEVEEASGK